MLDDELRRIIREEVRAVLRAELPDLLRGLMRPANVPGSAQYLTTISAAQLVGVRPETIRDWVASGALPRHGVGRVLRVRRDELEAFMARLPNPKDEKISIQERARNLVAGLNWDGTPRRRRGGPRR